MLPVDCDVGNQRTTALPPISIVPLLFSFLPADLASDDGVMVRVTKAMRGHMTRRGA